MAPRRFFNGISNVDGSKPLAMFPYLDPTKYTVYFEDFYGPLFETQIAAATATMAIEGMKWTTVAAESIGIAQDADANGCLSLSVLSADNAQVYGYTLAPAMRMRAGKKFFLQTRIEITEEAGGTIGQEEFFVGLADNAGFATIANFMSANGLALTTDDCVGFVSYDGSAETNVVIGENDVRDTVPVGAAMVDATWVKYTIYFDGTDLYYFVNDAAAGAFTPTAIPVSPVGPAYYLKAGEDKNKTLLVDYLFVACER